MACNDTNQSAISEVRDQLFLDTADENRLNIVTSNLGMDRPGIGFDDDEWRAVAKLVALQYKQIRNQFYRMIELCLGPQFARIGTLADATEVGDIELTALDASSFVQRGTLIIDPTLATEETIGYCIRDLVTQKFELSTALTKTHAVIPPGSSYLTTSVAAGVNSITVIDGSVFPPTPFPMMLDRGTLSEEILKVTLVVGNVLTLGSNTVFAHNGPLPEAVVAFTTAASSKGSTVLILLPSSLRAFPETGFIRIDQNTGSDEVIQYTSNDAVGGSILTKTPLKHAHSIGASVEYVTPGALVEVAQIVESGIHWSLHETSPRSVQIIIPKDFAELRLLDASWIHATVPSAFNSTLAVGTSPTDTVLQITSVSGFPYEAGMILVHGSVQTFYTLKLDSADVSASVLTPTTIGAQKIKYQLAPPGFADFPSPNQPYFITVNTGGGTQEQVSVIATDTVNKILTVTPALIHNHSANEPITLVNQLLLDRPFGSSFSSGSAVALTRVPYAGTSLEDGNYRDNTGAIQLNHFPGGYIYDNTQRAPSAIQTAVAAVVPPSTAVAQTQVAVRTNLEVQDASLWPAPPFTPFDVRIGEGTGFQEDRTLTDRTLKNDATATSSNTIVGATSMPYTLTSSQDFPESDGLNPAGYRVIINKGGGHQEIAVVSQNSVGTHTFTFVSPLTQPHSGGETIALLNDVLTFDLLLRPHNGPRINPSRFGDPVQPFISEIVVSPTPTNFPSNNGWIWLNFGKAMLNVRKRITTITDATHYVLASTALLPTAGYPYQITLSPGQFVEEKVFVTNNNTGTNTLTFASPGALNTHVVGQYTEFQSGVPEPVEYNIKETSPDRLAFTVPVLLESGHLVGETVIFSPALSASNADGSSFGFKLPPDPSGCLKLLFEFVRAAGVQVTIVAR